MLVVRHGGKCTCTGREEMLSVTRDSGARAFVVAAAAMVRNTGRKEGISIMKSNQSILITRGEGRGLTRGGAQRRRSSLRSLTW